MSNPSNGVKTKKVTKITKVSVNLPTEDVETLKQIAEKRRITITQALRQAIACERFFDEAVSAGGRVLIEQKDKTVREVVFRP